MSIIPGYYRVEIVNSGLLTASPSDGFIDPTTTRQYRTDGFSPTTFALSLTKSRANRRWKFLTQQLSLTAIPDLILDIETNADVNTAGTYLNFTVTYGINNNVMIDDILNPGVKLFEAAAVKRFVANAMVSTLEQIEFVWDPTLIGGLKSDSYYDLTVITGNLANNLTTAETAIAVAKINNTY